MYLSTQETEILVRNIKTIDLEDAGREEWLSQSNILGKLGVSAALQANQGGVEEVGRIIVDEKKVVHLVEQLIVLETWRLQILPVLLEMDKLYNMINNMPEAKKEILENMEETKATLGLKALSVLRYLTDNMSVLSLGMLSRLVTTHDVPVLLCQTLECRPWVKDGNIWRDGQWEPVDKSDEPLEKMEAQAWICLYNILSTREVMEKYQINNYRIGILSRLQARLQDYVIAEIPALFSLHKWLAEIKISPPAEAKPSLILEVIPKIKNSIESRYCGRWDKVAESQRVRIFHQEEECIRKYALQLAETYDVDILEQILGNEKRGLKPDACVLCGQKAENRCSRCKRQKYCSKECQKKHWPSHKTVCKINNKE